MKSKTIILTLVLFSLIVVGMYMYTRIKKTEINTDQSFLTAPTSFTLQANHQS